MRLEKKLENNIFQNAEEMYSCITIIIHEALRKILREINNNQKKEEFVRPCKIQK
jgi:hypothetical protein